MVSPPGGNSREVFASANSATPAAHPMLASDARARLQREVHALAMMPVSVASLKLSIDLGFERCGTSCSLRIVCWASAIRDAHSSLDAM